MAMKKLYIKFSTVYLSYETSSQLQNQLADFKAGWSAWPASKLAGGCKSGHIERESTVAKKIVEVLI